MMNISHMLIGIGALAFSSSLAACGPSDVTSGSTSTAGAGGSSASSTSDSGSTSSSGSTSGGGQQSVLTIDGKLTAGTGKTIPASADVIAAWSGDESSPDMYYAYVYGSGQSNDSTFKLSFAEAPPAGALIGNTFKVGLALLALFPAGKAPAEGNMPKDQLVAAMGAAEKYVIIYRPSNTPTNSWLDDFPVGYACGTVVHVPNSFDIFAPVDCSQVSITVDDWANLKFPNAG